MRWVYALAVLSLLGCSDEEEHILEGTHFVCEELDVTEFDACGGDVHGTWHVTDSCTQAVAVDPFPMCTDVMASIEVAPVGSLSFEADGTSAANLSLRTRARVLIPHDCLETLTGMTPSCADLPVPAGIDSCVDREDGCLCVGAEVASMSDSGTWSVEGSTLTTVGADGRENRIDYCVNGRFLDIQVQTVSGIGQVPVISRVRLLAPQ